MLRANDRKQNERALQTNGVETRTSKIRFDDDRSSEIFDTNKNDVNFNFLG